MTLDAYDRPIFCLVKNSRIWSSDVSSGSCPKKTVYKWSRSAHAQYGCICRIDDTLGSICISFVNVFNTSTLLRAEQPGVVLLLSPAFSPSSSVSYSSSYGLEEIGLRYSVWVDEIPKRWEDPFKDIPSIVFPSSLISRVMHSKKTGKKKRLVDFSFKQQTRVLTKYHFGTHYFF